eukprot:13691417-Alexandrium_andersonii.AAC.1
MRSSASGVKRRPLCRMFWGPQDMPPHPPPQWAPQTRATRETRAQRPIDGRPALIALARPSWS